MTVLKYKMVEVVPPTKFESFVENLVVDHLRFLPGIRMKVWNVIDSRRWSRTMLAQPLAAPDDTVGQTPHKCQRIACQCSVERACWWCTATENLETRSSWN